MTFVIILQVFVFDKTYLVLRYSVLVHPESTPLVHPRVHFFKVYFFMSLFPAIPLNRTKLKYRNMMLKAYEKFMWRIELGAIYLLGLKGSLLVYSESAI